MVRKNEVVKRSTGAVNNWEAEMEADAQVAAAQETIVGGGQFLGLKAGILSFNGAPMPNNEMRCVILDGIMENVYYEGEYEEGSPSAPTCFAYGRYDRDGKTVIGIDVREDADGTGMSPHKSVLKPQHSDCDSCPHNQFGSALTGKGKACKNTRRLALIPVQGAMKKGVFNINVQDTEHYATAPVAYLKTPVMSTKIYSAFVTQVASSLKRPPYGVFTRIFTQPDTKSQFTVNFEAVDSIPNTLGKIIMERHAEAMTAIAFPYAQLAESDDKPRGKKPTKAKAKAEKVPFNGGKKVPDAKKTPAKKTPEAPVKRRKF